MLRLLYFFIVTALFVTCKKDNVKVGNTVEIYLLKSFQPVAGKCEVNPSFALLQDTAMIDNQEIISYFQSDYQFELTASATQKVNTLQDFTPFAVTVDQQVIYYGFFKPAFSNSSCLNSITMDLDWSAGNKISLKLGYPGQVEGVTIDDERNNPTLIATLQLQGKLR